MPVITNTAKIPVFRFEVSVLFFPENSIDPIDKRFGQLMVDLPSHFPTVNLPLAASG